MGKDKIFMAFKYNDEIMITKGMFKGLIGRIVNCDSMLFGLYKIYLVSFESYTDNGKKWENTINFKPSEIRLLSKDSKVKEFNVIKCDFKKKKRVRDNL